MAGSGFMDGEKIRSLFLEEHGIGTRRGGTIIEPFPFENQQRDYESGDLATWPDGNPKLQTVVTLQTSLDEGADDDGIPDDGKRRLYIPKPSDLRRVTQAALRKAWASASPQQRREMDFEIGADFYATRTGKGEAKRNDSGKKLKPPWLHSVDYKRPTPGNTGSGVFSDGAPLPDEPSADDEPPF